VEVDLLWNLRWRDIAEQFGIERENTLIHFHSVNHRFSSLIKDLRQQGLPYVVTSHGQLTFRNSLHWVKKFVYLLGSQRAQCQWTSPAGPTDGAAVELAAAGLSRDALCHG